MDIMGLICNLSNEFTEVRSKLPEGYKKAIARIRKGHRLFCF
jgi:hypothetical protein